MRQIARLILTVLFMGTIFSACTRNISQNQLQFGIQAAQKDLWDEAIYRWKKVLLSEPNSASAHNNLAVAYEKKGRWEDARKEYELALSLAPNNKYIQSNFQRFKELDKEKAKDKNEKN